MASDSSKSLYDRNKAVYELLRYGIKVQPGAGENRVTVWLIDWQNSEANDFGVAEEVSVKGADLANAAKASTKRPDVVLYVNGIALGVLELKRSTVSVSEGIRQNLDNQKKEFIQPFFSTMQWVMAGNDTEGLRYATTETPEKYWLQWVEPDGPHASEPSLLDRQLLQVCGKRRLLELIHDFIVFDAGIKKVCRQNQYFGIKAAQDFIRRREGGIIWHTQGSGKSLTMVWLAKWIRENRPGSRVLVITDRTELDQQIEKVFKGVHEQIYRSLSGADLVEKLNGIEESLLCSLVHKFGRAGARDADDDNGEGAKAFIEALQKLPSAASTGSMATTRNTATSSTTRTCSRAWKARWRTTPVARWTALTRRMSPACWKTAWRKPAMTWRMHWKPYVPCASWWRHRAIQQPTGITSAASIRTVLEPALAAKALEDFSGVQEPGVGYMLEAETTRILELAKNQHDY